MQYVKSFENYYLVGISYMYKELGGGGGKRGLNEFEGKKKDAFYPPECQRYFFIRDMKYNPPEV